MLPRDEVIWGFRYLLGRDPESEATVLAHAGFENWRGLRTALLATPEFLQQQSLFHLPRKWVMAPVFDGRRVMWLDLSDRYVSQACILDNYEFAESRFLRDTLKPGDSFVDIGANVGWHTLLASLCIGESGRVTAFEPRPDTAAHLRQTLEANHLADCVTLHQCGLSDRPSAAYINNGLDTDNPGGSFVTPAPVAGMESAKIELNTLDSFNLPKVDCIKMDVEGSEMKVVLGGMQTIERNRPTILAEINPKMLKSVSQVSPDDFIDHFVKLNYQIRIVDSEASDRAITRYPADWPKDLLNVAMTPK